MATLTFLGAAGTVTGSKHLLEANGHYVLVDCGMFQGLKELRLRNWAPFPIDPKRLHAVVLTHAHLDHTGWLPRLVGAGFRGRVFCTPGTKDLCTLVLPDSAHLQEEDARAANRHGYTRHAPALPLYTKDDAARALMLLQPVGYDRKVPIAPGIEVDFINAGHLLGSAYARLHVDGKTILFGGDLGRYGRPVLPDPSPVDEADVLLLESTYGDRLHEPDDEGAGLARIVTETVGAGGKVIIPSFAIGRVEEVLYWLHRLELEKKIPVTPVYVDSPMAAGALNFYQQHADELDAEVRPAHKHIQAFYTERMVTVQTTEESKALTASKDPAIIIAGSGMATGGRVLYHLMMGLPDPRNTVLFVGYQAAGTRGRSLLDGAKHLRMKGQDILVNARIERIDNMSAHADAAEIMRWLSGFRKAPKMTYLVHGEPASLTALRQRVENVLHWPVHVARHQESVTI